MLRELAIQALFGRNKNQNTKDAEIIEVSGNGTYAIRWRGKVYRNVGSIAGIAYKVGQFVPIVMSYGQVFLP